VPSAGPGCSDTFTTPDKHSKTQNPRHRASGATVTEVLSESQGLRRRGTNQQSQNQVEFSEDGTTGGEKNSEVGLLRPKWF